MQTTPTPQTSNDSIYALQQLLRTVAKAGHPIPYVIPSGSFDAATEQAVRAYQRHFSLPETGRVDADTWQHLRATAQRAEIDIGPAAPLQIILQPNQVIRAEEQNTHLYPMQAMLKALGTVYSDVPTLEVTGRHDVQSQAAVRWLQKVSRLPETGEIDHILWLYLTLLYRAAAQDGT